GFCVVCSALWFAFGGGALLSPQPGGAGGAAAAHEAARALGGGVEAALGLIRERLELRDHDARAGVLGG
ncbi:MAG: hypothetical protein OXI57_03835, partial [Rhodospirillales bacterium]|nr:hypothetical protein [Rhodospirillales bacterium]